MRKLNPERFSAKTTLINGVSNQKKDTGTLPRKDIDGQLIRKQIAEAPIETLQINNNVEATIFQLGYLVEMLGADVGAKSNTKCRPITAVYR